MEGKNVSKDDFKDEGIEEIKSKSQFDGMFYDTKKKEVIEKEEAMETEETIQKAKAMEKGKAICYDEETEEKKSMASEKLLQDAMKGLLKVEEPRSFVDVKSNIMFPYHHQENSQDDIEAIKDYLYSSDDIEPIKDYLHSSDDIEPIKEYLYSSDDIEPIKDYLHSSDDSVTGPEESKHDEDTAVEVEFEQPKLPIEFVRRISQLGGVDIEFVIEKKLSKSDVDKTNPRLRMPYNKCQIDLDYIGNRQVKVTQPPFVDNEEKTLSFKKWDEEGSYVFDGESWSTFVDDNVLMTGDLIQVWKFGQGNEVCFALVKPIKKD